MATEVERKFLVAGEGWRRAALGPGLPYRQGYLPNGGGADAPVVRIRMAGAAGVPLVVGVIVAALELLLLNRPMSSSSQKSEG